MLGELLGKQKEPAVLPDVQEQSQCSVTSADLKEGQTSPPKHFTEDLLLHAMETASADSMPEDVERQGIGTPATRAATIEKLVQKGFLERKGNKKTKVLLPTDKGKALITVMPEEIQSPEMTADWETKLLQIEHGEMEPSEFMTEINTMITELVKNTEMKKGANIHSEAVPTAHHPPDTSATSQWAEIFESSYRLPCGTLHLLQARRELKSPASGPQ